MEAVKEYVAELNRLWSELKTELDAQRGAAEEKILALNQRMDAVEEAIRGLSRPAPQPEESAVAKYFGKLRDVAVGKAFLSASDVQGGYLVAPPQLLRELIRQAIELFPFRRLARTITLTTESAAVSRLVGEATAFWAGEGQAATESTSQTMARDVVYTHEMRLLFEQSKQNLEDSLFDFEVELRESFARAIALTEGLAFTKGDGVGKPEGFTLSPSVNVFSGAAASFGADTLIEIIRQLKEPYIQQAVWVMNTKTLYEIRKLKTTSGDYVWAPAGGGVVSGNSIIPGLPATIVDRPYVINPHMDDIGAANRRPIAIGDWRMGYLIADRLELDVQVDPYSNAVNGMVRFWGRRRVGGMVLVGEAISVYRQT